MLRIEPIHHVQAAVGDVQRGPVPSMRSHDKIAGVVDDPWLHVEIELLVVVEAIQGGKHPHAIPAVASNRHGVQLHASPRRRLLELAGIDRKSVALDTHLIKRVRCVDTDREQGFVLAKFGDLADIDFADQSECRLRGHHDQQSDTARQYSPRPRARQTGDDSQEHIGTRERIKRHSASGRQ